MPISPSLLARNEARCELCHAQAAEHAHTLSPKTDNDIAHQVALCNDCLEAMGQENAGFHWRCLEGSIWSMEPVVQALSYRLLQQYKEEDWAAQLLGSVDLDEEVVRWAMHAYEKSAVHLDAFGNVLENGDTVVLTQALNVKGTSFSAAKGTVVKKIKLVHDNIEQIEGKINEQIIVILTKYVKKGS